MTDTVRFTCSCGAALTTTLKNCGMQTKCPKCGASVIVPFPDKPAATAPPPPPAIPEEVNEPEQPPAITKDMAHRFQLTRDNARSLATVATIIVALGCGIGLLVGIAFVFHGLNNELTSPIAAGVAIAASSGISWIINGLLLSVASLLCDIHECITASPPRD